MSFAVEVPGEATPLSLRELARVMDLATFSTNHNQRQSATQQLAVWESHPGYFSGLQSAFLEKSLTTQTRHLAIIQLKNGIDKYWRSTAKNAICPAEKELIRSRLFQGTVDEELAPLALQNALTVAKVIRIDYPKEWSEALPHLIDTVRTAPTRAKLGGALILLLRVIKELSTARLRRHQDSLRAVAPELVQLLGRLYTDSASYWVGFLTESLGDEDSAEHAMQNSLTAFKLLRRLFLTGYEHPHQDLAVQQVWAVSQTHFGQFLEYVSQDSPVPAPYQDVVGKHLIQFTKLHISMAESRPTSFAMLPASIPLTRSYWGLVANFAEVFEKSGGIKQKATKHTAGHKSKMGGPLLEKLALKGLVLLRHCVGIVFGPKPSSRNMTQEMHEQSLQAIEAVKHQLLTDAFVLEVVEVTITKLFIFRQSDLEAWEADPEEWEAEASQDQAWEWAVRPCSERLFLDLLIHYEGLLRQPLLNYFAPVNNPAADSESQLMMKEAVYAAMGCAAPTVYETFDFDNLLTTTLVNDLRLQHPLAKLLRRRIAILISQWITVKLDKANKSIVYEIYCHLMDSNDTINDEVVCFTAARNLRLVVEELEFYSSAFLPFAPDIFTRLIDLLKKSSLDDTRQAILETLRAIVGQMGTDVAQFGDAIMMALPQLWDSAESDVYVIKQPILTIMSALVNSMNRDSQRYQGYMIPLLKQAMDPNSQLHLFLVEEAVEMWGSILNQSVPPLSNDLVELAPLAFAPLEFDTSVAYECLKIVKAYILLAPEAMLGDNMRRPLLDGLAKTLDVKDVSHAKDGSYCIEAMIRAAETLGGAQGISVIIHDLTATGFLSKAMSELYHDWQAGNQVGPNKPQKQLSNLIEENYFAILSRLALASPALFIEWLTTLGSLDEIWEWLSRKWFDHIDAISGTERKKLSCLALTRLCELPEPVQSKVLHRLQDYMTLWISLVEELQRGVDQQTPPADYLVWAEAGDGTPYDTAVDVRERELAAKDPVHTVHTYNFMQEMFRSLVQRVGEQNFQENWLINVDKTIVDEFKNLGTPRSP